MSKQIVKKLNIIIWVIAFIAIGYSFTLINDGSPIEIPTKDDFIQDIEALTNNNDSNNSSENKETTEDVTENMNASETYKPIQISIPSVEINLEVKIGRYDSTDKTWEIGDRTAYWANLSDLPSENDGNTLIYAHNTSDAFYPLRNISMGDYAYITADTGETLIYEFFDYEIVEPTDDSLFYINDLPRLTLLTCNGSFSQVRRLMYFRLVEIENTLKK